MFPLCLHTTPSTQHLPPPAQKSCFLWDLELSSSSGITYLGCCSHWSWWPQVEVGVDRVMDQGPGLRSSP